MRAVLTTEELPRCSCRAAAMSCSSPAYASASGLSIGTLTTSSVYGGRLAEMSSNETNAPISMRKLPNSSGNAPGRSFTRLVTFALEQAFSWGSMW